MGDMNERHPAVLPLKLEAGRTFKQRFSRYSTRASTLHSTKKMYIWTPNLYSMKNSYLLLISALLLSSCVGTVKITGQSDDLKEGGTVVVSYPTKDIPNVPNAHIPSWAYSFIGRRVEPDSNGYFSMAIPIRRASEISIESGNKYRHVVVDKGDSLHLAWQRGDSTMRITGRQKALSNVAGYYDAQTERELRRAILEARDTAIRFHCGEYVESLGKFRDTLFVDSILLSYNRYMLLQNELMLRFGTADYAVKRKNREMHRRRMWIVDDRRCPIVGGDLEQFYRQAFSPRKDAQLPYYYTAMEEMGNHRLSKRKRKDPPSLTKKGKNRLPSRFQKVDEGVGAAWHLVFFNDGDILYDSLRYAKRLEEQMRPSWRRHPAVQLHRMVYDARMAWLREPYQRFEYNKEAQPLDSILARSHKDSARGYAVWLWLEDDDEFIRNAKAFATAERALKRMGVRSVYVPFYEGESLTAFTMYRLGLKEPFATITLEGRTQLLNYLGEKPLRRSRCLLFDSNGNFVTADLPESVEANRLAERVEKALEKN